MPLPKNPDTANGAPKLDEAFLRRLPKTDLHVHLDGSLRVDSLLDMAEKQKVKLPANDADGLKKILVQDPEKISSLVEYLRAFDVTLSVLQQADAIARAAYELAEDCHKENVRYVEVRYSPILHQQKGLSLVAIVEAVLEGLDQARRDFGVLSGVIICGIRSMDPSVTLRMAELTVAFKDRGVVGFDLAGAEHDNPAKEHADAFHLILSNNINCTVHAGEAYGPPSIAQALHYCGAHRLGHAVRLREDGSLLNYVNDHRIPIECCITSNVQTHTVTDFGSHPIRSFHDFGMRVTVNTDNRLMSDTSVTRELLVCVEKLGFGAEAIRDIIIDGFKSAFLPYHEKRKLLAEVVKDMDEMLMNPSLGKL